MAFPGEKKKIKQTKKQFAQRRGGQTNAPCTGFASSEARLRPCGTAAPAGAGVGCARQPKPPPRALIIRTGPRSAAHGRASKPLKDSAGERRAVSVAGSRRGAEGRGTEPHRGTDLGVPSQGRAVHGWEPPLLHPAAPDVWPRGKGSVVLGVNHTLSLPPAAAWQLGRSPLANGPQLALALERQRVREQRAQRDEAHRSLLGPLGCQGMRDTGAPG